MTPADDLPILELPDQAAWEAWLAQHGRDSRGVWLKLAKKGAPRRTVSYAEAVDGSLCHGWIDGQVRRFDEHFYLQRFTPRTKRSRWSQVNREKAERLIAAGRMAPAGLSAVRAAQADGRWEAAYPPQSQATVPEDLQRALDGNPRAAEFFAGLTGAGRYAFLYRLHEIRDPERRASRIEEYIELLAHGRTLTP